MEIQAATYTAGQHGYTPPLEQIQDVVVGWLPGAIQNGIVVVQIVPGAVDVDDAVLQFELHVECYRQRAGSFYGVQAVRITNEQVVELRVRPPGYQWQHQVNLICPSSEITLAIFGHCRPEAVMYLARQYIEGKDGLSPQGKTSTCGIRYTPPAKRTVRSNDKLVRTLCHERTREAFAYLVRQELQATGRCDLDESRVVHLAFTAANRTAVDATLVRSALIAVVDTGILDPIDHSSDRPRLRPTIILDELADRHERRLKDEERQQLERQLASKTQLLETSQREETRLRQCLQNEQGKQTELQAVLAEIEKRIRQLTPTDES